MLTTVFQDAFIAVSVSMSNVCCERSFVVIIITQQSVLQLFPGGGGALSYKPIRNVPFFRVSFSA